MAEIFVMPKLGLTMEEGFLASWLCEPGAAVALGEAICEVETDKLTVAVESPYAGVLLNRIEPGGTVPVGAPIAVIGEPGEDASAYRLYQPAQAGPAGPVAPGPQPGAAQPTPGPQPAVSPRPASGAAPGRDRPAGTEPASSPLARRIAATLDINLADVAGTGPDGRITREDVERTAAARGRAIPPASGGEPR